MANRQGTIVPHILAAVVLGDVGVVLFGVQVKFF
jgi:hypothetical protein